MKPFTQNTCTEPCRSIKNALLSFDCRQTTDDKRQTTDDRRRTKGRQSSVIRDALSLSKCHPSYITAFITVALLLLCCAGNGFAATYYSRATGDWNQASTWSTVACGGAAAAAFPVAGDIVNICNGNVITVTANAACASIAFTGANATLTINSGFTLTMTSTITLNSAGASATACTINGPGAITGVTNIALGTSVTCTAVTSTTMTFTTATLTTSGTFTLVASSNAAQSSYNQPTLLFQSGTITVGDALTTTHAKAINTSTINMNSEVATGTLNLKVTPALSATGTNTMIFSGGSQTVNYNGTVAQTTVVGTASPNYNILKINNAAGVTLGAAATVTTLFIGDDTPSSIFNTGGKQVTSTGTLNLTSGTFILGGSVATTFPAFGTMNISTGTTVEYANTGAVVQWIASAPPYYNLKFSGASQKTFAGSVTILGDYTQAATNTNNVCMNNANTGASAYTFTVGGNFNLLGNIFYMQMAAANTGATVTVTGNTTISGTACIKMDAGGSAVGSVSIFQTTNFTNSSTSTTVIDWGAGAVVKSNQFRISGNFSLTAGNCYTTGSVVNGGFFFNGNGSTQTFSYTATYAADYTSYTVSPGAYLKLLTGLTLGAASNPTSSLTVYGILDCSNISPGILGGATNGTFTLASGGTLVTANANGVVSAAVGSISTSVATRTFDNAANYIFNGTANQNTSLPNSTMNNLTINNTGAVGSNSVTFTTPAIVNGILTFLTSGIAVTTATNIISVTNTSSSAITGGSTASYVSGPLKWTLPASLASGSTYVFPTGKGTATTNYYPFTITNPITGTTAPAITVEAFATGCGGFVNATLSSLSATEYWATSFTGTYLDGNISLTRQTALSGLNAVGRCLTAANGTYTSLEGSPDGTSINNSDLTGYNLGYFVMAVATACIPPSIVTEPSDQFACGTNPAAFSITAANATSYQWQYNSGSWNPVSNGVPANATYTNQSTPTLNITNTGIANGTYLYRCVATNACTSTDFNSANLSVNTTVPACSNTPSPANSATGISTTPTLSWASVSTATSYKVYFSADNPPALLTTVTSPSYTPPALSANTIYYWYIVPVNGCGDASGCGSSALWSFTTAVPSYCTPASTGSGYPITRVIFAGIDNSSSSATNVYEDFTASVQPANVVPGKTFPLSVYAKGTSNPANVFYGNVFIDWNQNGVFTDAGEEYQLGSYNTIDITYSGNITVPSGASSGTTRMRIMHKFSSYSTSCYSGGNNLQVEDYKVNVCCTDPGTLSPASTVFCSSPSSKTITIANYTIGSSIQWQYSPDNSAWSNVADGTPANATYSGATSPSLVINNNSPGIANGTYYYKAKVTGSCTLGSCSNYSNTCIIVVDNALCSPSGPYTTGFETCDATMSTDMTTGAAISVTDATSPNSGSRDAYIQGATGGGQGAMDASFITPSKLVFFPGRVYTVEVWAHITGTGCSSNIKIVKSATGTNAAMNAATGSDIIMAATSVNDLSYILFTGSFSVSAAESKYIGIQAYTGGVLGCGGMYIYIDDVAIKSTCTQCSNGIQDGDETGVDCGGSMCYSGTPTAGTASPDNTDVVCGGGGFTLCLAGSSGCIQWQFSPNAGATWWDLQTTGNNTSYSEQSTVSMSYRAKVTYDGCTPTPAYSNVVTVTVTGTATNTWNGGASGVWATGPWSLGHVPTNCEDVTIPDGTTVTVNADASVHNLVLNSGTSAITLSLSSAKYLNVYGNLTNNGAINQSAIDNTCGLCLFGRNSIAWDGAGTYNNLTVKIADNSNIFMINSATIAVLDATKTTVLGTLNLNNYTLKVTNEFKNSGSSVHVNTGFLWLAVTSSISIDQVTLYPDYGTVFFDLTGNWTSTGDWSNIGGTGFYDLKFKSTAGTMTRDCDYKARNDFIIESGTGTVLISNTTSRTIKVAGDFINNDNDGTPFNAGISTFIMNGTVAQAFSGTSATTFYKLTINNTSAGGVTLNNDVTVNNTLTLTDGIVNTTESNLLTIGSSCSLTGTSDVSHVKGPVSKITGSTSAFAFPTGDGTFYRPISVIPSNSTSTTWTSQYYNAGHSPYTPVNSPINHVSGLEYWDLARPSGSNANITLTWNSASYVNDYINLTIAHWSGSAWENVGGTPTGTNASGTITSTTAWATFSPFTLGSKTVNNPLPIELLYFTASCNNGFINCKWSTATEINNDHFTLERSYDAESWEKVAEIKGAGNSNQSLNYEYYDNVQTRYSVSQTIYYRLSQVDFDGKQTQFNAVAARCENSINNNSAQVYIFPNPACNKLNIVFSGITDEKGSLVIYDQIGKKILTKEIEPGSDWNKTQLDIRALPAGQYYLKCIFDRSALPVQKFVISRCN